MSANLVRGVLSSPNITLNTSSPPVRLVWSIGLSRSLGSLLFRLGPVVDLDGWGLSLRREFPMVVERLKVTGKGRFKGKLLPSVI